MQPSDIASIIDNAIERHGFSGGRETLIDILTVSAPKKTEYWADIAMELHVRKNFYDALDCWLEAEKYIEGYDDPEDFYNDMSGTLDNAYEQTDDLFFREQALRALGRSNAIKPGAGHIKRIIRMSAGLGRPIEGIRRLIEDAFEFQHEFKNGLEIPRSVLGTDFWGEDIYTLNDLAEVYLWENNLGEAFRIWSKCVADIDSQQTRPFTKAIFALVSYAQERKLPIEDYLPDNLNFDSH